LTVGASTKTPSSDLGGLIVLEGAFLVERAISAALELKALYCVPARKAWAEESLAASGKPGAILPTLLSEAEMAEKAGYPFHRGAYAIAERPRERSLEEALDRSAGSTTVLVLPELGDPENLGAAFRNAAALGCGALFLGPTGPDPLCRRVLRVSMGASLSLPWARLRSPADMSALAERGYTAAACVLDPLAEGLRAWKRPDKLALVLGNEAFGLSPPWLGACATRLTLPMLGSTDSLNLATAAAVFLFALSR
jgi:tRNA G18 (ribose-2'-O)-methylase SpoU